ncbi:hypothetical protein C7T96_13890 [Nitratireductor sp. StC3]|nr:hypothetical protein C7T96_13890 [Nitratireductor sp. StC3]
MHLEFAHQVRAMVVHRLGAYAQMFGDTIVGQSARDALQHLRLAVRKTVIGRAFLDIAPDAGPHDGAAGNDVAQALAQFLHTAGFQEKPIRTGSDQPPQGFGGRATGHDGDFRLRAPAPRLEQHFQPGSARHDEIEHGAVGRQAFDLRNRLDAVAGRTDNLEFGQRADRGACTADRQRMIIGNDDADRNAAPPPNPSEPVCKRFSLLFLACFAMLCQLPVAQAQDRTLVVDGPVAPDTVGNYIDLLLDADHSLTIAEVKGEKRDLFSPITTRVPDMGYSDAMIWLRLRVENVDAGNADWRLHFKENFKQIFHVYIVDDSGRTTHPLAQDRDSAFSTRPVAHPEVVIPLSLKQGEAATVYVRFWTEGATYLPLAIETAESFTEVSTRQTAKQFIYYGMMVILIVAALLAGIVLRHPIFPAYIAYSTATLVYIMHVDGVAFQYLWPSLPAFNSYASVVAGGSYAIFGAIYARIFLNTAKYHRVVDKALLAVIIVTATMIVAGLFAEPRLIKKYMILVVLFAVTLFTVAALLAARKRFKQVRFYVFAWLGATASATLMMTRHWFGIDISQEFQHDSMRMVMIFDAVMMGLAIVDRYHQLREERQKALRASLEQARRNLDMNTRLRNLEARYELALETTARHKEHIENTVHDIRQPLHALRLAVQGVMSDDQAGPRRNYADIYDSFDYLEALVANHLKGPAGRRPDETGDEIDLGEILRSVHEMFVPDAETKGLRFRFVETSLVSPIAPLAVMRIVSNLVSNAIKYTPSGKLLLGVRRLQNACRIELHDTGPGLTAERFQKACQRGTRLDSAFAVSDGKGHGLAIVVELAERYGYKFELLSTGASGTALGVTIPFPHIQAG